MFFILSHDCPDTACRCHLGLLCHAFSKISRTEGRVALRYHPRRKVRYKVQTFQGYNACRHQITGGEETVLQVGRHCLLAGRDCGQVFHLDAQHDVEKEQYIEAHEVEHGPVEMYRQVTCQPFCPGTFPFRQQRERPLQRAEYRQHTEQYLLAVDRRPLANVCKIRENKNNENLYKY